MLGEARYVSEAVSEKRVQHCHAHEYVQKVTAIIVLCRKENNVRKFAARLHGPNSGT